MPPSAFPQQFRIFLNADLSIPERAFIVVAQLCLLRNLNGIGNDKCRAWI
jgi:hypothetical protein